MPRPILKCSRCRRRPRKKPYSVCAQCWGKAIGNGMRRRTAREALLRAPARDATTPLPDLRELMDAADAAGERALKAALAITERSKP
jgi:hypothetical protein